MSVQSPPKLDLSKYIDTQFYGERPHIRGRRLPVSYIAGDFDHLQWSIAQIAENYSLSEEQVLAAILYYRENKAEIDAQDVEEQQLFDEMYRLHGKKEDE